MLFISGSEFMCDLNNCIFQSAYNEEMPLHGDKIFTRK